MSFRSRETRSFFAGGFSVAAAAAAAPSWPVDAAVSVVAVVLASAPSPVPSAALVVPSVAILGCPHLTARTGPPGGLWLLRGALGSPPIRRTACPRQRQRQRLRRCPRTGRTRDRQGWPRQTAADAAALRASRSDGCHREPAGTPGHWARRGASAHGQRPW